VARSTKQYILVTWSVMSRSWALSKEICHLQIFVKASPWRWWFWKHSSWRSWYIFAWICRFGL